MADRDPLVDLPDLAAYAEDHTTPPPPEQIRLMGTQRRRRRHVVVIAATVVVVALGGGAVLSQTSLTTNREPGPVASQSTPSAVPVPARAVTTQNLVEAGALASPVGDSTIEVYDVTDAGHRPLVACVDAAFTDLSPVNLVSRSFEIAYPDAPATARSQPTFCSVALQFSSAEAAEEAAATYEQTLRDRQASTGFGDNEVLGQLGFDPTPVDVDGGTSSVTEVVYRAKDAATEAASWESHGVTVVGDRVAVTVYVHVGNDWYASMEENAAADGMLVHPQRELVTEAAQALAR